MTSFKNACALKKLSKALCLLRNCFSTIVWHFSCPCVQKHKLNLKKKKGNTLRVQSNIFGYLFAYFLS